MTIDWWTLALQAINFLVLAWLLHRFFYRPVLKIVERRRRLAEESLAQAEQARQQAEAEAETYREKQDALAQEREVVLADARSAAEREREEIFAQARDEVDKLMQRQRARLETERAEALQALREQAAEVAVAAAERLLAQAASASWPTQFLERLDAHLRGLDDPERARMLRSGTTPPQIHVFTAPHLDEEGQKTWRHRLATTFGQDLDVVFADDMELIAGARIEMPAATLAVSWKEALRETKDRLLADEPAA